MDNITIIKILQNQATEEEKNMFFSKCEADQEFRDEFIRLKNLWTLSVGEKHNDKMQQFKQFWAKVDHMKQQKAKKLFLRIGKYAASIMLVIGLSYLINPNLKGSGDGDLIQTFTSEAGSVSSIELKDGSRIWLSSGSELRFTEKTKKRVVASLSGEAYFEIEHNDKREFIVNVDKLRIYDLGTKFNIKAYKQDHEINATLIEGIIDIQNTKGNRLLKMKPNEHFSFNKSNNKYHLENIDPTLVTAWKDGKFVFIDKTLRQVCDELERWYDVDIIINNRSIESEKYTSVLKRTTTIKQMLEMLKYATGIKYKITINKNGADVIIISKDNKTKKRTGQGTLPVNNQN